jgi:hypothetical protein
VPAACSWSTVRDKTGARNRAELTRYAMQAGIEPVVPFPDPRMY